MYDKQKLSEQAKQHGFVRDTLEKVIRLAGILKIMESDPLLSQSLALKGGTAINLTVFSLPRLSVDIDLDYAYNNSRDEMMAERGQITSIIGRYMAAGGYELSNKSKYYHSLDSFVYVYDNSAGIKDNVKIEVNYSMRCHIFPLKVRAIETMGVLGDARTLTVEPMEIFASKIVALLTRAAARDLFDISNMIEYSLFDKSEEAMLRKSAVFYSAASSEEAPNEFNISRIDSLTSQKIRTDLKPLLHTKDTFDLPAVQKRVKGYLENLLRLEDGELRFLEAFRSGEYRPELIFSGDILERVRNHPMIKWKMQKKSEGGVKQII